MEPNTKQTNNTTTIGQRNAGKGKDSITTKQNKHSQEIFNNNTNQKQAQGKLRSGKEKSHQKSVGRKTKEAGNKPPKKVTRQNGINPNPRRDSDTVE